jgi:hypothetical protein
VFEQTKWVDLTLIYNVRGLYFSKQDITYRLLSADNREFNGSALFISKRDLSGLDSWLFSIKFKAEQLGTHILAIYFRGRQLPNSPFRINVERRSCSEYPGRISDISGNCICQDLNFDISGSCISYGILFPSILVPSIFLILLGVFILHNYHVAKQNSAWMIDNKELTFPDQEEALGVGSSGTVLKAYLRNSAVAVKTYFRENPRHNEVAKNDNSENDTINSGSNDLNGQRRGSNFDSFLSESKSLLSLQRLSSLWFRKSGQVELREHIKRLVFIRHPCIVTVMGAVSLKSEVNKLRICLVMELMECGTLADILHNHIFHLEAQTVLQFIQNITRGMNFLHSCSPPIMHGDLKSPNILIDSHFNAKISDLAMNLNEKPDGTRMWMAPECLKGEPNTTSSDVYSFGIVLYECMHHRPPFFNEDTEQVQLNIVLCKTIFYNLVLRFKNLDRDWRAFETV